MDEKRLLKYAVDYLSKYDSTTKNLTQVLKRKIFKINISDVEKKILLNSINNIILLLKKNNLIDDYKFGFSKFVSLSRLGKSKNFIFNYLLKKRVDKNVILKNLEEFEDNDKEWEINSAKLFVKKKRMLQSSESYEKKLAKMARAGFSYDICKKILS